MDNIFSKNAWRNVASERVRGWGRGGGGGEEDLRTLGWLSLGCGKRNRGIILFSGNERQSKIHKNRTEITMI